MRLWRCWQSAEQLSREMEAADAASVARLVRDGYVLFLGHAAWGTPLS